MMMPHPSPAGGSDLHQRDLDLLKSWRVQASSRLLTPGHQCRVCLMLYRAGELVRKLPDCNHIFHASCIDPWLLHRRPNCPLDGQLVAPQQPQVPPPSTAEAVQQLGHAVVPGQGQVELRDSIRLIGRGDMGGVTLQQVNVAFI